MDTIPLEQVIRTYTQLEDRPNSKGFWPVLCRVCNDHGKKGKRAGFKFEGSNVGYNCFNCGHSARFDSTTDVTMSKDMITVLSAWGIPEVDWRKCISIDAYGARTNSSGETTQNSILSFPQELHTPDHFYYIRDDKNDDMAQAAIEYLSERSIKWSDYPYMISSGQSETDPIAKRWFGRLIIPYFANRRLIFWQGRDILGIRQKKYLSPDVPRDAVIGGFDNLFVSSPEPLIVTEGWLDCLPFGGCCVFSNRMTPQQIAWLNRSQRRKVVIPDKFGDGARLAEQALKQGWEISTPDIGGCKDVNAAIIHYGSMYVKRTVFDSISSGFDAQINIGLYCS